MVIEYLYMSLEEKVRLLLHLDSLIRIKTPGKAKDLARKMNTSERTFFSLLKFAREELNAPIVFDHARNCYCYSKEGGIHFGFLPIADKLR